jgi:tryptophan-rich sensory protein
MIFCVRYALSFIWNPNEFTNRNEDKPHVKIIGNTILSIAVIFLAWCIFKASSVLLLDIFKWSIKMYGLLAIICETFGFVNFGDLSRIDEYIEKRDKDRK